MTNKYFGGVISNPKVAEEVDAELISMVEALPSRVEKCMNELKVQDAIDEIIAVLRRSNKYIDETMPWSLAKDEAKKDRLATVLYNLLESIRVAAIILRSYLPETAEKILDQIGTQERSMDSALAFGSLETGINVVAKPEILFARIDEKEMLEKIEADKGKEEKKEPEVPEITIEDFAKVELKVGTVVKCEKHPKADNLLVSQVRLGNETRQIVSGIASHYKPEEMVGKKVVVVVNLKPAKLRGVESQGMILAGDDGENLGLLTVDLPDGTEIH